MHRAQSIKLSSEWKDLGHIYIAIVLKISIHLQLHTCYVAQRTLYGKCHKLVLPAIAIYYHQIFKAQITLKGAMTLLSNKDEPRTINTIQYFFFFFISINTIQYMCCLKFLNNILNCLICGNYKA